MLQRDRVDVQGSATLLYQQHKPIALLPFTFPALLPVPRTFTPASHSYSGLFGKKVACLVYLVPAVVSLKLSGTCLYSEVYLFEMLRT